MKKSLKGKIMNLIFAAVAILEIVNIYMNYRNFISSSEHFSYSTAKTVAETCSLIIDNDEVQGYINTSRRNTSYYEVWNKLLDYRNTNEDIVDLSVTWFDLNGAHYVFDTDLTDNGAFLGDICAFDSKQEEIRSNLISGKDVGYIKYANKMDVYLPLLSSTNSSLGYVVVGISTLKEEREQRYYLYKLVLVSIVLTFLFAILFMWRISKYIINPINTLSKAAGNYIASIGYNDKSSVFERLSIHTGDEIERLFLSIKKMETDLLNYSNSLSIATWNSNHDSMTQLYNKRYLTENIYNNVDKRSVAAYYFDVDNLKKMNDICGHEHGDDVICRTAEFIKIHQPENGFSFRMGGDEFLMLVFDISAEEAGILHEYMKEDGRRQLTPPESKVSCRIALGYAYTGECADLDELIEKSDKEMYLDKQSHRE